MHSVMKRAIRAKNALTHQEPVHRLTWGTMPLIADGRHRMQAIESVLGSAPRKARRVRRKDDGE